jgi:hypothetical protein
LEEHTAGSDDAIARRLLLLLLDSPCCFMDDDDDGSAGTTKKNGVDVVVLWRLIRAGVDEQTKATAFFFLDGSSTL